jgi:predicted transcriptional regulator YdeE
MQHNIKKPGFKVIGIFVDTTNENLKVIQDLTTLWAKFQTENIFAQIPDKLSQDVYEVFTDYQGNYQKPYRTIIGCKVADSAQAPAGMIEHTIPEQTYRVYPVKGKVPDAIGQAWFSIWQDDDNLNRAYIVDFNLYGPKSADMNNAELEIFVGIRD